jgi:hypothetical protein
MATDSPIEQLDGCECLFLSSISEPEENGLILLVQEGLPAGEPQTLQVGTGNIGGVVPIDVTTQSRAFELHWPLYISYAVRNESFCTWDEEEEWVGFAFRIYTQSKFLDFVARGTFASTEYPGPFKHYQILCANHIIDVAAQDAPVVRVVGA